MIRPVLGLLLTALLAGCGGGGGDGSDLTGFFVSTVVGGSASTFTRPVGVTVSADGQSVFFTASRASDGAGAVYAFDLRTNLLTQLYAGSPLVSPTGIAASPDGVELFVADTTSVQTANVTGTVFRLTVSGSAPVVIPSATIDGPTGMAIDGTGLTLSITAQTTPTAQPTVISMDTGGGNVRQLAAGAPLQSPGGLAISPDNALLFAADPTAREVYSVPAGGGTPSQLSGSLDVIPTGVASDLSGFEVFVAGPSSTGGTSAILGVTRSTGSARILGQGSPIGTPVALAQSPVFPSELYVADTSSGGSFGAILLVQH